LGLPKLPWRADRVRHVPAARFAHCIAAEQWRPRAQRMANHHTRLGTLTAILSTSISAMRDTRVAEESHRL
jgi:hypothetical protein